MDHKLIIGVVVAFLAGGLLASITIIATYYWEAWTTIDLRMPVLGLRNADRVFGLSWRDQSMSLGPEPKPRKGFLTFLDPGLTISSIKKSLLLDRSPLAALLEIENSLAAHVSCRPCWRQVRMTAWENLWCRVLDTQHEILPPGETAITARVAVVAMLLWYEATEEWLYQGQSVRCTDDNGGAVRFRVPFFRRVSEV